MSDTCSSCGAEFRGDDLYCPKCGAKRPWPDAVAAANQPTQQTSTDKSPATKLGFLIALTTVVPVFFFLVIGKGCSGSTEGQIVVRGGPRPGFTFRPTSCDSMQPYGRFGANLHGDGPNDGAVYVTRDPSRGPSVEVEIPGSCRNADGTDCTVFTLPRESCRVYQVQLSFNGVVVNDVRQVEGQVAVECTLEDGTVASGRITFEGC